jgi:hypothetical protein
MDVWVAQVQADAGPTTIIRFDERTLYDAAIRRYGRRALSNR